MATVRLFASVAEAAGTRTVTVEASTVAEVLEALGRDYGEGFVRLLPHCRLVVNGEPVDASAPVGPDDEVAILPPVAGG